MTDIDDTVKSSGGVRLLWKVVFLACSPSLPTIFLPARWMPMRAGAFSSLTSTRIYLRLRARALWQVGPALGGIDTQYKRGAFYPGELRYPPPRPVCHVRYRHSVCCYQACSNLAQSCPPTAFLPTR